MGSIWSIKLVLADVECWAPQHCWEYLLESFACSCLDLSIIPVLDFQSDWGVAFPFFSRNGFGVPDQDRRNKKRKTLNFGRGFCFTWCYVKSHVTLQQDSVLSKSFVNLFCTLWRFMKKLYYFTDFKVRTIRPSNDWGTWFPKVPTGPSSTWPGLGRNKVSCRMMQCDSSMKLQDTCHGRRD